MNQPSNQATKQTNKLQYVSVGLAQGLPQLQQTEMYGYSKLHHFHMYLIITQCTSLLHNPGENTSEERNIHYLAIEKSF